MAVGIGQRCLVRVKITDVELRNARDIVATVESPQYVAHCQEVAFDEVSGLVYVAVDVNSVGPYSMWLEVRFAEEVVYTPVFVFAEVEGETTPCDAPYIVDVEVSGDSVSVTPPKVDVDAVTREEFEQLSSKVDDLEEQIGSGSITIDTELSETSNNAVANSAVAKGLKGKQNTLTLTTKPNGNIVIGNLAGQTKEFMPATPSGDPMHYAYEVAGATWNASTGYWKMYTLTDVTNEQMRAAVARGVITCGEKQPLCNSYRSLNNIRFNLSRTGNYMVYLGVDIMDYYAYANETIEVINLTFYKNLTAQYDGAGLQVASLNHAFCGCSKLRQILGKILASSHSINTTNAFNGCTSLEDLRLAGLGGSISFADSPLLSNESILYMIENATATTAITITLHEDAYMRAHESEDIIQALDGKEKVSIASA